MTTETVVRRFFAPRGATSLSYGVHRIDLETVSVEGNEPTSCTLDGGLDWVQGRRSLLDMPLVMPMSPTPAVCALKHGTIVVLPYAANSDIGHLYDYGTTCRQWEAVLRDRTALGSADVASDRDFLDVLRVMLQVVPSAEIRTLLPRTHRETT